MSWIPLAFLITLESSHVSKYSEKLLSYTGCNQVPSCQAPKPAYILFRILVCFHYQIRLSRKTKQNHLFLTPRLNFALPSRLQVNQPRELINLTTVYVAFLPNIETSLLLSFCSQITPMVNYEKVHLPCTPFLVPHIHKSIF